MARYSASVGIALVCVVLILVTPTQGFYIPGAAPVFYEADEPVHFSVNSLRSYDVMFPQEYYRLPFCKPANVATKKESMGELIWGDKQQSSLYVARMLRQEKCVLVPNCSVDENTKNVRQNVDLLKKFIDSGYRGYLNIDNLPAFDIGANTKHPTAPGRGYPLGVPEKVAQRTLVNNHLDFVISYNGLHSEDYRYMVVGLTVTPRSVKFGNNVCDSNFEPAADLEPLSIDDIRLGEHVHWTYSVRWEFRPDILWATRWDAYFHSSIAGSARRIHLVYIFLSITIVLFVSSAVAIILVRALRLDFMRYSAIDDTDMQEETGWKLIYADVFRKPEHAETLSVFAGTGAQLLCMAAIVIILAVMGLLSPSRRGSLLKALIMTYIAASVAGGLVCGTLLNYFNSRKWKYVFLCGVAFPSIVCGVFVLGNMMNAAHGATSTVRLSILFSLVLLWVFVNIPLMVIGAAISFRFGPISNPVAVGRLAREIPKQKLANDPLLLFTIPPLFPLCAVIMELYFIMDALWRGQVYYVFGFLSVVGVLWVLVVGLVTIFHVYYLLCNENHEWWWYSFLIPGCMGAHVMVYSLYFFATQMSVTNSASALLYFLYMGIFSLGYGLASGTIGLISSIIFVRFIYSKVRLD